MENDNLSSFESLVNEMDFIPLISLIYRNEQKYLDKQLKDLDISSGQISCLMKIYEYDDFNVLNKVLCQKDLVDSLKMSKGTIASALRKLEDNGYILRELVPNNRRKYNLSLTEKGRKMVPKVIEIDKKWEKDMDCDFIDEEFKNKLRKIAIRTLYLNDKSE